MSAKQVITQALKEVFEEGDANAGQVYKGYDYNSAQAANGWWYKSFQGDRHIHLGKSVAEAKETIEDIKSSRE